MNQLVLVGLSHKTAPIEVRERVAFQDRRIVQSHQELVRHCGLKESLILSTCIRRCEGLRRRAECRGR